MKNSLKQETARQYHNLYMLNENAKQANTLTMPVVRASDKVSSWGSHNGLLEPKKRKNYLCLGVRETAITLQIRHQFELFLQAIFLGEKAVKIFVAVPLNEAIFCQRMIGLTERESERERGERE